MPSISRRARASPRQSLHRPRPRQVLHLFTTYADLLHGRDGGTNKTGTLAGVRTLAGYADTAKHGRVRFVISLKGNDGAMRYKLLKAIEAGL